MAPLRLRSMRLQGSGIRARGVGFRIQDAGFKIPGSGFRGHRVRCGVEGAESRGQGSATLEATYGQI